MSLILDALKELDSGPNAAVTPSPAGMVLEGWRDEALVRLESAVAQWDAQVTDGFQSLSNEIGRLQQQLGLCAEAVSSRDADRGALAEAQAKVETLREALARRDTEMESATERIVRLTQQHEETVADLQRMRLHAEEEAAAAQERRVEIETLRGELAAVREQLTAARAAVAGVEALEEQCQAERTRADLLEEQVQTKREGTAGVQQQLATAIRERDTAYEETLSLKSEIDALHRINASLTAPSKIVREETSLDWVPVQDADGHKRRMGEILLSLGLITRKQLEAALNEQALAPQRRLGVILVETGYTSEEVVAQILSRQLALPFVRLTPEVVDENAPALINAQLAKRRLCIPIDAAADHVMLAMANPLDLIAIDDVELASGRRVHAVVATMSDITAAIQRAYGV